MWPVKDDSLMDGITNRAGKDLALVATATIGIITWEEALIIRVIRVTVDNNPDQEFTLMIGTTIT